MSFGSPDRSCGLAAVLSSCCCCINVVLNPARFAPASLGATLGLAAPLILAAMASMPPILAGRGGIDISVGPLMGLVNAVVVRWLIEGWVELARWLIVPAACCSACLGRAERLSGNHHPHPADRRHARHLAALCRA